MDRIWQWAWDRHGARYSWAVCAIMFAVSVPGTLLLSLGVVAVERSGQYAAAGAVGVVGVLAMCCVLYPPGDRRLRLAEQWAAGHKVDRAKALEGSYSYGRGAITRGVGGNAVGLPAVLVAVCPQRIELVSQYPPGDRGKALIAQYIRSKMPLARSGA